jgi:hypothetical protein
MYAEGPVYSSDGTGTFSLGADEVTTIGNAIRHPTNLVGKTLQPNLRKDLVVTSGSSTCDLNRNW